jgi:hypothetical protein
MRAVKEPPAYRASRVTGYRGATSRSGPVRGPFALLAIACTILVAAVILLSGILG